MNHALGSIVLSFSKNQAHAVTFKVTIINKSILQYINAIRYGRFQIRKSREKKIASVSSIDHIHWHTLHLHHWEKVKHFIAQIHYTRVSCIK